MTGQGRELPVDPADERPTESWYRGIAEAVQTILQVEDDDALPGVAVEHLADLGYLVLPAQDAGDALGVARRQERLDLLLTDVILPGVNGRELAVVYMSGYTDHMVSRYGVLGPGIILVSKPFTQETLARPVRRMLGAGARPEGGDGSRPAREVDPGP